MSNTLPSTDSELISTSFDEDVFIPIDLDWKKKYYKRVWKKRIKAYLLDTIIIFSMTLVLSLILNEIFISFLSEEQYIIFQLIQICFFSFAVPVLTAILESSKWRGAFGKEIMRIEVTDNFGKSISFWKSIWRNILKGFTFYICLTIIGYFIQRHYYLKTGKFIHDNWSKTIIGERLSRKPVLNNIK